MLRHSKSNAAAEPVLGARFDSFDMTITLKSDLCVGSGDGFSSGIDQDVCYDVQGLPYIPGRRLKGCLRAGAEDIGLSRKAIDVLFGISGSDISGALTVSNAQLDEGVTDGGVSATIERHTYTRAQTKVDRVLGTAAENTLRFVRVVNHYRFDGRELTFTARVILDKSKLADAEGCHEAIAQLARCVRGLRNIGMERNRGLGAVSCKLLPVAEDKDSEQQRLSDNSELVHVRSVDQETAAISYVVRLDGPVMLPQQNGDRGHACIPGTSVMGFFASRLNRRDDFEELFFGGGVRFSPLYPMDSVGVAGNRCYPAAPFVAKVKAGVRDGLVCRADTFQLGDLESLKPLKDGFMSPATWQPVTVDSEITYHHSRRSDGPSWEHEGTLYTQQCLSAGQMMGGFIECPRKWVGVFEAVLAQGRLSFGRSKSAQYGQCALVRCDRDLSSLGSKIDIKEGNDYVLLFESDALLIGGNAAPDTSFDDLIQSLRNAGVAGTWLRECDVADASRESLITNLSIHTVGGYNSKWNQKRPHVRALSAGSCLAFRAAVTQDGVPRIGYIGARQTEGYGRVRLISLGDVKPSQVSVVDQEKDVDARERVRLVALAYADEMRASCFAATKPFGSSFVGRLTMMVDESQEDSEKSFRQDLDERVASVKDEDKRNCAEGLIEGLRTRLGNASGLECQWQTEKECLLLVLTLGKFFLKQASAPEGSGR